MATKQFSESKERKLKVSLLYKLGRQKYKVTLLSFVLLTSGPGRYIALDCEMVGIGADGTGNALARVSVVNYYGNVLLDTFVVPRERVTDWRTKYSGIRPADVRSPQGLVSIFAMLTLAIDFDEVQMKVGELIKGRILVGHSIQKDLDVLGFSHPRHAIRDTSHYEPFRTKYGTGKSPSLKKVVQEELSVSIQDGPHDSVNLISRSD